MTDNYQIGGPKYYKLYSFLCLFLALFCTLCTLICYKRYNIVNSLSVVWSPYSGKQLSKISPVWLVSTFLGLALGFSAVYHRNNNSPWCFSKIKPCGWWPWYLFIHFLFIYLSIYLLICLFTHVLIIYTFIHLCIYNPTSWPKKFTTHRRNPSHYSIDRLGLSYSYILYIYHICANCCHPNLSNWS